MTRPTRIHPTATISRTATIGAGVFIGPRVRIYRTAVIPAGVTVPRETRS